MKLEVGEIFKYPGCDHFYEVFKCDDEKVTFVVYRPKDVGPRFHPHDTRLERINSDFCKNIYKYIPDRERLKQTVNSVMYVNCDFNRDAIISTPIDCIACLHTDDLLFKNASKAFAAAKINQTCTSTVMLKITTEVEQIFEDEINEI